MSQTESFNHILVKKGIQHQPLPVTLSSLEDDLQMIEDSLLNGAFDQAKAFAQSILDADPCNHQAYAYMVLIDRQMHSFDELLEAGEALDRDLNYKKAVYYGNQELAHFNALIKEKIFNASLEKIYYQSIYAYLEQDYFTCKVKLAAKLKEAQMFGYTHGSFYEKLILLKNAADTKYAAQKEEYIKFYRDELTSFVYFRNLLVDIDFKYDTSYSRDLERIIECHHRYLKEIHQGHFHKKRYDMNYEKECIMNDIQKLIDGYAALDQERYEEAYKLFRQMGDCFHVDEIRNQAKRLSKLQERYHYALAAYKEAHYYRALNAFSLCLTYKDSAQYYHQIKDILITKAIFLVKIVALIDLCFFMYILYLNMPK